MSFQRAHDLWRHRIYIYNVTPGGGGRLQRMQGIDFLRFKDKRNLGQGFCWCLYFIIYISKCIPHGSGSQTIGRSTLCASSNLEHPVTLGQISHLRQSGVRNMHNLINIRFLSGHGQLK